MLISQCQKFNDSFNNDQIDLHTSNKSEEKLTERRPVIRLAKFAVDPSSQKPEKMSAFSDKVVSNCDRCIESNNYGKLVHTEDEIESQIDNPASASPEFPGLSDEIDIKTDILDDIDDKQIMTIDLKDENQPSTSSGFSKEIDLNIETIEILDEDDEDEKNSANSKAQKVCFKYMEYEKYSLYNLQQRSPNSKPEPYVILTSSVEAEKMIATKLFISKSNFDQIDALNVGDWVWLMAQFTFYSADSKNLSHVGIELQGVPAFNAFIPKDIDEVEKCIQSKANFVLSKKRISHILKCYKDVSHRICRHFIRHGKLYFVNCSESLGLEWIGLMFEYDETLFRRKKFVKKYPLLNKSFIADTERHCKRSILDQYSYNSTDLSESNARLVDSIVGKLEVMIREKLAGKTWNQETELQKQVKHYTEARNSKVKVIQPRGNEIQVKKNSKIPSHLPPTFLCPQVHKHKCSQTFSFTSHEDVTKLLEHLDIPAAVRDLQYKDLWERLKTNPKDTLFKDCFYNKHRSNNNSSLFYLFCDAEKYGDIVSEDMLAAIKKNLKRANMKRNLMQYMTFLSAKDSSPSTSASIDPALTSTTEEEIPSASVPLLQLFPCPQCQAQCPFSLSGSHLTFKDVSIMLRHLEIPKEVKQSQHDIIKKIYQDTISSCPFCNCNLLVRDAFYHFEHHHSLVSALFYLYTDAELYGDKVSSQLLSLIRKVLPEDLKYHLDLFLNIQQNNKNDQSQAKKDHQTELSSSSSYLYTCPQKDKHNCSHSFVISSYEDVVKMADHIDIPAKVVGFQLHHLFLMADENGRTGNHCPLTSCQLLKNDKEEVVNHFKINHQVESMIFYLFWDAKDYGELRAINLLCSIKMALPSECKLLLADYLKFMQTNKNVLGKGVTVPKVQVMISDEVRFDIEILESNPECAKSLPSSTKSSETNAKNAAVKKKKRLQCSQTRGVVTDVELDKIVKNYDKEVPSSEAFSQEKLRIKRQEVKRSKTCSQEELRNKRLEKNISKFILEVNQSREEDEDDPAEVDFAHDDFTSISPEPSENIAKDSSKVSAEIIHVETEPLRSQTFSSFDEMLGITEDRTLKRKHEDNESDLWKKLKSSDTQSIDSGTFKSSHRYIYCTF